MKLKHSAQTEGVQPPVWYACGVAEGVYRRHGFENVGTSLNDSHTAGLHPEGLAVDCRTRGIPQTTAKIIFEELHGILNPMGYDVIHHVEGEMRDGKPVTPHIHIEYQPKGAENWIERVA